MVKNRAVVFSRVVLVVIVLIASQTFAQDDMDDILPPQASPETGEVVRVPEEGEPIKAPPPRAPRPQPPVARPATLPPKPTTPARLTTPAGAKFVPLNSSAPATAAPAVPAAAKVPTKTGSQRGGVIAEEATVFKDANFESEVIATVKAGTIMEMSVGKKDVFYKVRVKPGLTGFISDAEIKPLNADNSVVVAPDPEMGAQAKKAPVKKKAKIDPKTGKPVVAKKTKGKPIHLQKYRGLVFENVNFAEDTMDKIRTASLTMLGFRWSGNDVVIPGPMYTDAEILFYNGAPSYYADATGNSASGLMITGNFLVVYDIPQSRDLMTYFGFGPMFRFSQFRATLSKNAALGDKSDKEYQLTDLTIGGVFGAGVAVAVGDKYAVRLDGRYYWEAQRYTSFSLAIQMEW